VSCSDLRVIRTTAAASISPCASWRHIFERLGAYALKTGGNVVVFA
jgi:hypothetical protein